MAGHVRRRGSGWQARYPDPSGRTNTAKVEKTFRTKREAEDWLVAQQASIQSGTHIAPRQASVRSLTYSTRGGSRGPDG